MEIISKLKSSVLLKSGLWYTVANFMLKGVNFFTIPIFTKMMSVDQYGSVDNFLSWVSIFTVVIGLNLNASINNANFEFKEKISNFLSSILFLGIIFFTVILLGLNIFFIGNGSLGTLRFYLLNFVIIQSFSQYIVTFLSSYFIIKLEYKKNIFLVFLSTLLNIGVSLLLMLTVWKESPDIGRIVGSTFGIFILGILISSKVLIEGKTFYDKEYWQYALKLSLPVIPHSLGNMVLSRFDRIIIQHYQGAYYVGLYGYIYNISSIINVLWTSVNNAWVPWFYAKMEEKKYKTILNTSTQFTYLFAILAIGAMTVSTDLAKIMAPRAYQSAIPLIIPISLSYFFMFLYSFSVNTEFYFKKTSLVGIGTVLSAAINVVLNLILIPKYGYMSAGITNLVTYVLLFLFHQGIVLTVTKEKIFPYKTFFCTSIIMLLYSSVLFYTLNSFIIKYLIMIVVIAVIMAVMYKKIMSSKKKEGKEEYVE